jgi:dihydroorotate dehydrogenase
MIGRLLALAQPALLALDPERAHGLALEALKAGLHPRAGLARNPRLAVTALGLDFPNPVGMAAGFDKNGEVADPLLDVGFGFAEVGSVTPRPQPGNPRPRVFRLIRDRALINLLGFNNDGHEAVARRLAARPARGIVGVNIGANKDSADRIADYAQGIARFAPRAAYLTVNISSPNTPALRALQEGEDLDRLLAAVTAARDAAAVEGRRVPLLLKVAPDLTEAQLQHVCRAAQAHALDGLIVSNTTLTRPASLRDARMAAEAGGLSGAPLFHRSTVMLARAYRLTEGRLPLIGVGGVTSGGEAVAKIRAGASLVQLYTGFVYGGFALLENILDALLAEMQRERAALLADLTGRDAENWAARPLEP